MSDEYLTKALATILDRKLFFVAGQAKSGTTWLQLILDAHPEICCRGEGHLGDVLLPALGESMERYNSYIRHNNSLFKELPDYPTLAYGPSRSLLQGACALLLYEQCGGEVPPLIGERTPANITCINLLHEIFPDAHFVHIIRDVRDIAVSFWFHGLRTNPDWIQSEYGSLESVAVRLAESWVKMILAVRHGARSMDGAYHEILYEHLHEDFDKSLRPLLEQLGACVSDEILQTCRDASAFENVSGGREVGVEDRQSHFRKGVVGDWRDHLEPATAERVSEIAGELIRDFGYD